MIFYVQSLLVMFGVIVVKGYVENIHFGHRIQTNANKDMLGFYVFEMTPLNDIQNCVESCKSKKQCKGINYDHCAKLCHHVAVSYTALVGDDFNAVDFIEKKPGFSYGHNNEWNMTAYKDCESCNEVGVCNNSDDPSKVFMCQHSGCRLPEDKNNATYRGNMFSIGNQIAYECKAGYKTNSTEPLTSTCLENGTWSSREFECLPEVVFGDNVYEFDNNFFKLIFAKMNWRSARDECSKLKLHLIDIKSHSERNFIQDIVPDERRDECYWTGGVRVQNKNKFKWLDGELIIDHVANWGKNQPNDDKGSQDCITLNGQNLNWNDRGCSIECFVICELS